MAKRTSQLALGLVERSTWGGRRPGAGRKRGEHAAMAHAAREPFGRLVPAHITLRIRPGLPSLRDTSIVRSVEQTFANGCERRDFRLVQYSLQGNHAHLIVEARDQDALGRGMMAIGSRLAGAGHRLGEGEGAVVVEQYHHRLLPTPREAQPELRYLLLYPPGHA